MPFQVCSITKDGMSHPLLEDMCKQLGVEYRERYYNSWDHWTDREHIVRLPAFHLYENNSYIDTYYQDTDIEKLETIINNYIIRKTNTWKQVLIRWLKTDFIRPRKPVADILSRH